MSSNGPPWSRWEIFALTRVRVIVFLVRAIASWYPKIEPSIRICEDLVPQVRAPLEPSPIHARQHQDVGIHVVIDCNDFLAIVKPVQTPDVLL